MWLLAYINLAMQSITKVSPHHGRAAGHADMSNRGKSALISLHVVGAAALSSGTHSLCTSTAMVTEIHLPEDLHSLQACEGEGTRRPLGQVTPPLVPLIPYTGSSTLLSAARQCNVQACNLITGGQQAARTALCRPSPPGHAAASTLPVGASV